MDTTTRGPAPARTDEQRREALIKANRIRTARARLKRRIKYDPSYRLLGAAIFADTEALELEPDELATMRVFELLMAAPKLGRVKVNAALNRAVVSPSKTVGGLTARQREELVVELGLAARRRQAYDSNRNYSRRQEALYR